jgi:hypothetical protein
MRKALLILLVSLSFASVVNFTSSVENFKIVNGDGGLELLAKASVKVVDVIPVIYHDDLITNIIYGAYFGFGVSQQYTAPRASVYAFNHYGDRIDWSIGGVFGDFEAIYTHSMRNKYTGASPDVIFFNQDIDSFKIRFNKQFNF